MDRPKDYDGSYSLTVKEYAAKHGKIANKPFWSHVKKVTDIIIRHDLKLFHIFQDDNMIVQKKSEDEWRPVLIDLKSWGIKEYPWQVQLRLRSQRANKIMRRLRRFEQKFRDYSE